MKGISKMRDISALHPELRRKALEMVRLCDRKGMKIGIGECLRTVAEQDALYAQGRTKPGLRVTNARGSSYSSQHQWGIAFDFYRNDGTGAYNNAGNFFEKAGAVAKSLGLGWGGDWQDPVDPPHVYLPQWGSTTQRLKQLYQTPERFMAGWAKAPVFRTNKSYVVTKACYLRTSAGAGGNRAAYASLSKTLKKKCRSKSGFAVFQKGKRFRLMRTQTVRTDVWGEMKSGYWVPLFRAGQIRVRS